MAEPYTTGTISVTAGSDTVAGVGTLWASTVMPGDMMHLDGLVGAVAEVLSHTSLRLYLPWGGQSRSGVAYAILPTSPDRYDAAVTQEMQRAILSRLDAGLIPSGATRPQSVAAGGLWRTIISAAEHRIAYHDGSDDITLMTVNPVANTAKLPAAAAPREVLTADRTYYVRIDGSDTNNGLVNSPSGAFASWQGAWNVVSDLDLAGRTVTIQGAGGPWSTTGGVIFARGPVGGGMVIFQGDASAPSNYTIDKSAAGGNCLNFIAPLDCVVRARGLKLKTSSVYSCLAVTSPGVKAQWGACDFAGGGYGVNVDAPGSMAEAVEAYTISGGGSVHWAAFSGGMISCRGLVVTLTGTPAFSYAFANAGRNGTVLCEKFSGGFVGGAAGTRYICLDGGGITTAGAGATYLPGNAPGGVYGTGWYS